MPPGTPARHRAPANPPSSLRRARYLLPGLLVLPLLAALGVYLSLHHGPGPAPASATAQLTAQPTPPSGCDPAAPGARPAPGETTPPGSDGPCAGHPFHAAVATVPASASPSATPTKHPSARPSSSASAPASPRPAAPATSAPAAGTPGTSAGGPAAQVLALINQARSAAGLAPLTITAGLNASASRHNATMAGGCRLSHQCPGEPDLGAR
jgi:cysteine-rich secretory family protein